MLQYLQDHPHLVAIVALMSGLVVAGIFTRRVRRARRRTTLASSIVVEHPHAVVRETVTASVRAVADISPLVGHTFIAVPRRSGRGWARSGRRAQCAVSIEPLTRNRSLVQFQGVAEPPLAKACAHLVATSFCPAAADDALSAAPMGTFTLATLAEPTPFAAN